jgi:uncharacterized repeat protein (TIGR02543 family)
MVVVGISLGGSAASRTIVPDFSSALTSVTKLEATLTGDDGVTSLSASDSDGAPWKIAVPKGTWDMEIVLWDDDEEVGKGELQDVTVTAALTVAVPITFTETAEKGTVSFKVSFPDTLQIDYVHGLITEENVWREPSLTPSEKPTTGTFSFEDLNTGIYSLVLTFKRGGKDGKTAGIFREKIVVVGGYTSGSWVKANGELAEGRDFTADDFYSPNAALGALTLSGAVLSPAFAPATYTFDAPIASFPASVSFTATGTDGQYLEYALNAESFTSFHSGTETVSLTVAKDDVLNVRVTAPDRETKREYKVTFRKVFMLSYNGNSNDGGSPPPSQLCNMDGTATVAENTGSLTRAGYVFSGWMDGTGSHFFPKAKLSGVNSDTTLYADWQEAGRVGADVTPTLVNATTGTDRSGKENPLYYNFAVADACVTFASPYFQLTYSDAFSASVWFKTDSLPSAKSFPQILHMEGGSGNFQYFLYLDGNNSGRLAAWVGKCGTGGNQAFFEIEADVWYHAVMTYSGGTGGTLRLYVNSVVEKDSEVYTYGDLLRPTTDLTIGTSGYRGTIGDVRIYNKMLDAAELADIFAE